MPGNSKENCGIGFSYCCVAFIEANSCRTRMSLYKISDDSADCSKDRALLQALSRRWYTHGQVPWSKNDGRNLMMHDTPATLEEG